MESDHARAGIHILEFGKEPGCEVQRERNAVNRQLDATAELVGVSPAFLLRNASIAIRIDQGENPGCDTRAGCQVDFHIDVIPFDGETRGLKVFIQAVRSRRRGKAEHNSRKREYKEQRARLHGLTSFAP